MGHYQALLDAGVKTAPGVPTKLMLLGEYMYHYNVLPGHTGEDDSRPLDITAIGPAETLGNGSLFSKYLREYDEYGIYEIAKISFLEYMQLTVPQAEDMKHTAELLTKRKLRLKGAIIDEPKFP